MPIVFVHGVSVRKEHDYYQPSEKTRNEFFRQIAVRGVVQQPKLMCILNPYWGGLAASFAWNRESLPGEGHVEAFGSETSGLANLVGDVMIELSVDSRSIPSHQFLTVLARKSLPRAIDVLWNSAAMVQGAEIVAPALAANGNKAQRYAAANVQTTWLNGIQSDAQFVDELLSRVDTWNDPAEGATAVDVESFGISDVWNHLTGAVVKLGHAAAAAVSNPIVGLVRPFLNEKITLFVGDAFSYLRSREKYGPECPIVNEIGKALTAAQQQRTAQDPLIVIGHSMGGVIAYDVISSALVSPIGCDLLLTVGSQVAIFEEMKLFHSSDPSLKKPGKVHKPAGVKRWINVFDRADVLSYKSQPVFDGVEDFEYFSGETVLHAHGAYLLQPRFHQRLNARILEQAG